jgi:DNA-directed RNA polymerase specialized sigma24 family protein
MSRRLKTGKKNRATYRYYNADGSLAVELFPGEDGVSEADISLLHSIDDGEVDAARREDYRIAAHIDAYGAGDDPASDLNPYLADTSTDPQEVFARHEEERCHQTRLDRLASLIDSLSPEQLALYEDLFVRQMSGRRIAAREGVTEGAIRKRKNALFNALRKKM